MDETQTNSFRQVHAMTQKYSPRRHRPVLALAAVLLATCGAAWGSVASTVPPLRPITVNLQDKAALRNGALYAVHMCVACHSLQGVRYSSLAKVLGLSRAQFLATIGTNGQHYHDTITSNMPAALMEAYVKIAPPDLTVIAERRSPAWLYTYLTSFYVDPSRPTGVNNTVRYNVAMPDVFASMQGLQKPVVVEGLRFGSPAKVAVGVQPLTQGTMTKAQFDQTARDIVSFLYAVAHPHQQERERLGPWILGLFLALSILTYLIYKLYWSRVITSKERWWRIGR
jgi:ubiquinol-cytochrome c reductase cytochrome c1 subunit